VIPPSIDSPPRTIPPDEAEAWSTSGVRLRPWQADALARFEGSAAPSFLAVATPGAGKTTFALAAALRAMLSGKVRRLVVVVPTQHLKQQWAHAAERLRIHLDPEWSAGYGALPSDVHGVVVTYQQVAANPAALRPLVRGALVVLDEIHHAGESRTWGDAVRHAFEHAARRLCLSGTPFRSDQNIIPFVRYEGDLAQAEFEYGYGDALADRGVVRPVYFPRINGHMEWTAPDGIDHDATFDDPLTRDLANQRLRTALDPEGEWLPTVLARAHAQLQHLRRRDPSTGGLVIAVDQDHARGIAGILHQRLGVGATIATSDDPGASEKISAFAVGTAPWIVAVRMVSEGVDIPRLRVGVYATNTTTELFFRQAVGRLLRFDPRHAGQTAYMFIPDDVRLRAFAAGIAEQRRHCLRKPDDRDGRPLADGPPPEPAQEDDGAPQLSLFSAISAVPLDEQGRRLDDAAPEIPDLVGGAGDELPPSQGPAPLVLVPVSPPLPAPEPAPPPAEPQSALARRRELREKNSALARDLVFATGKTHAEVNAELNRRAGIRRISEATAKQLERRLEAAKAWLTRR
jgi:superfamily II DNA or RNA helicase